MCAEKCSVSIILSVTVHLRLIGFDSGGLKMSRTQELISVLAEQEVIARATIAKAHSLCKICGQPATDFSTQRAAMEYSISMICQSCQDYYFAGEQ